MTMIRKQFFIDREQSRRLRQVAATQGLSDGELIRKAIDRMIEELQTASHDWKTAFDAAVGSLDPITGERLAERVAKNREQQSNLWDKRMARNRRQHEGK